MANTTLLINVADLRNFTDIGNNYNATTLSNSVIKAQEYELREIVGQNLIERYQSSIENSTALPASYNSFRTTYINPFLVQASYYYLLGTLFISPRNNSLSKRIASPSSATLTQGEFNQKRALVRQEMDFYADKIVEFLSKNSSDFPELTAQTEVDSDRPNLDNVDTQTPLITRQGESKLRAQNRRRRNNNNIFR